MMYQNSKAHLCQSTTFSHKAKLTTEAPPSPWKSEVFLSWDQIRWWGPQKFYMKIWVKRNTAGAKLSISYDHQIGKIEVHFLFLMIYCGYMIYGYDIVWKYSMASRSSLLKICIYHHAINLWNLFLWPEEHLEKNQQEGSKRTFPEKFSLDRLVGLAWEMGA